MVDADGDTFQGACNEVDESSPQASDCTQAADKLPSGDCEQTKRDGECTVLENHASCDIIICGEKGFKTDCDSVSVMVYNLAEDQPDGCTVTAAGDTKGLTDGQYTAEDNDDNYIGLDNGNTACSGQWVGGQCQGASIGFIG